MIPSQIMNVYEFKKYFLENKLGYGLYYILKKDGRIFEFISPFKNPSDIRLVIYNKRHLGYDIAHERAQTNTTWVEDSIWDHQPNMPIE